VAAADRISRTTPVYLEGGIAYSRYDPTFLATSGQETRDIPVKWVSATLNGGVGWDFPVAEGSGLELDSSAHDIFITRTRSWAAIGSATTSPASRSASR